MADKDLYLAADVSVKRGTRKEGDRELANVETIAGGVAVGDTDLSAKEVKELQKRGAIRRATEADEALMAAAARRAEREEEEEEGPDISKMKKDELVQYAAARGIEVEEGASKAEILDAIEASGE